MSARLAIGVVLYRNPEAHLARLRRSLEACRARPGTPPFTLALWDNSLDGVTAEVARTVFPEARLLPCDRNLGFGAGHNRLMAEAFASDGTHAYLCLNPDALLDPRCLLELEREASTGGPGLIEARLFPDEHPKPYDPVTHRTPWACGCVLRVDRAAFETLGGFDEQFFMYCEDVDLSWRARAAGLSVRIAPAALAHHSTLRREGGGARELMVLRSSAILGFKYGANAYAEARRAEYLARGGEPFPVPVALVPAARRAARFDHRFTFVEPRW